MRRMSLTNLVPMLFIVLISACAQMTLNEVDPKIAKAIKKITVISVSAEKLYQLRLDPVFTKVYPQDISAWKLDEGLARQVTDAVSAIGKYEVITPVYDRARLASELNKLTVNDAPYLVTRQWKEQVLPLVREVAEQNQADTVVLLLRYPGSPGLAKMSEGLGTLWTTGGASKAYFSSAIYVMNGKTGDIIVGRRVVNLKPKDLKGMNPVIEIIPTRDIPKSLSEVEMSTLSSEQKEALRQELVELLRDPTLINEAVNVMFSVPKR